MVFGCQSLENTAKTSVLDRFYAEKRVNYGVFYGKHCKNTVKNNVSDGFFDLFLYICSVGRVFKGLGKEGNWKHYKTKCFGTVLWRQIEGKHCKNMQTHFKKHGIRTGWHANKPVLMFNTT